MQVRPAVVRLWLFCHTPEGRKLVRYGLVSVVSALFAFTVLTVVYGVLQLWTEVPSVVFSNILATFFNYYLNRRWVWGKSGRSNLVKEVIPFWILSISGMVLALFTASLARQFSDTHDRCRRREHLCVRNYLGGQVPHPQPHLPATPRIEVNRRRIGGPGAGVEGP
jgi:putative flippase GtrA